MTIKAPRKNIFDKILAVLGKQRDTIVPENTDESYRKYGPYVYIKAKRESFWKALLKKRAKS